MTIIFTSKYTSIKIMIFKKYWLSFDFKIIYQINNMNFYVQILEVATIILLHHSKKVKINDN